MSGVATHDVIMCKTDMEGKLLATSYSDSCKGASIAQSIKDDTAEAPRGTTKPILWIVIKELYSLLPDTRRMSTHSSESVSSFTAGDLQETLDKLKEDLLGSLPDLVAPKVSKILAADRGTIPGNMTLPGSTAGAVAPVTPIKRYLTIKDKGEEGPMCEKKWTTVVKTKVEKALNKIPVLDLSVTKKRTNLMFETDEQLEQAKEVLSPFLDVSPVVEKEKKKDPRIMINDLDQDMLEKDSLLSEIVSDKNASVKRLVEEGHVVRVVHVNKAGRYAVIQVSPDVRKVISDRRDKLFLKLRQHPVRNRFYVTQCFHCQRYGHVAGSVYCPNKDKSAVCAFCTGDHDTRTCQAKKDNTVSSMKCVNCDHGGSREDKRHARSHPASSSMCPFYINAKARLMESTSGVTKEEKNVYQTRAWEDLRGKRLGRLGH
jgi:hypothetical protein